MLRSTFCHIPGIGAAGEKSLWQAGVRSWDELAEGPATVRCCAPGGVLRQYIDLSRRHLEAGDCRWFAESLPAREHWRMFAEFRSSAAYIDIETTGLSAAASVVTTIALYDGRNIRHYVRGENLEQFARDIGDYGLIVTFNGKTFDLPFLRDAMGLRLGQPHIDLRYVMRALGYRGGLKAIERQLGIERGELHDVDGYAAVLLWHQYRRTGNPRALETLLAYNICDVLNLETLLVRAYNMNVARTPLAGLYELPSPPQPRPPFEPDPDVIAALRPFGCPPWQRFSDGRGPDRCR